MESQRPALEEGDEIVAPTRTSPDVVTRKSSVASYSEEGPFAVDRITKHEDCELYVRFRALRFKCAIGMAYPAVPNAVVHHGPIAQGYCKVSIDEVMDGYEDMDLDIDGGDGISK